MLEGDECYVGDCFGFGMFDCATYEQFTFDIGQCERGFDGGPMLDASETSHVVQPPKYAEGLIWEPRRATMIGPSTINGELVFIPTMSGEVYVHSVLDGEYVTTLFCPEYDLEQEDGSTEKDRAGTRSGQTMFDDYLIFYCGATCMC